MDPFPCADNKPQAELFAAINEANIKPWSKTSFHLYCEHSPSVLPTPPARGGEPRA